MNNSILYEFTKKFKIGNGNIFLTHANCLFPTFDMLSLNRYLFLEKEPTFDKGKIPLK